MSAPETKAAPEPAAEPDSLLSRLRRVADAEPEQLDLEDAIAAAVAALHQCGSADT